MGKCAARIGLDDDVLADPPPVRIVLYTGEPTPRHEAPAGSAGMGLAPG